MLGLAGWRSLSNTLSDATGHRCIEAVQPLPNSYKQWMNAKSITTSVNLTSCAQLEPSEVFHRYTEAWGLIKKSSDSYQLLCVRFLFEFAAEHTDLNLGHNLLCLLLCVPVVVGHNRTSSTHSWTWQSLRALAVSALPEYAWPVRRVLRVSPSTLSSTPHTLPSQLAHFVPRLCDPHLQRIRSLQRSEAWQTRSEENTAAIRSPLCPPVTLMTNSHRSTSHRTFTLHHLLS